MRVRTVALGVGATAAALLLALAGGGFAMQLGPEEGVAVIRAIDVDRATIQQRVEARRAELGREALARAVKLGNRQALLRYLREHTDVDPNSVVFQRGARNYAGPDCPGPAWNCTTARHVVQISSDDDDDDGDNGDGNGGENRFSCTTDLSPDLTCLVVQGGPGPNTAECIQRTNDMPVVIMNCTITQTNINASNTARVEQDANHSSAGGVQNVTQHATVSQTNMSGRNYANVVQDVDLTMRGTLDQLQDAHQKAELNLLNNSGDNGADVRQTQDLFGEQTALVVDQRQNTLRDPVANCAFGQEPDEPDAPNSCASIFMDTEGGDNDLDLDQSNDLTMSVGGGGDDDGDDDNGDDDGDDGDDGGNGDDDGDDNGDDDGGGFSPVTGFQQQGTCEGSDPCTEGDDPDGGTEAGIDMFSTTGNTNSHMTGLASADMPDNTPLIEQLQFTDPWCCYETFFTGEFARSEIDLRALMDGGEDTYQTGENGLGCIVDEGDCVARLVVRTEDGTFSSSGQGPVLFAHQQCTHFGSSEVTIQQSQCDGVEFTTTTDTSGPTLSIGGG